MGYCFADVAKSSGIPQFAWWLAVAVIVAVVSSGAVADESDEQVRVAAERGLNYLAQEVRRWPEQNGCFSCHNNGDAARVLYYARHLGLNVPPGALDQTDAWLARPDRWDKEVGDEEFKDPELASIQFGAALTASQGFDASDAERDERPARGAPDPTEDGAAGGPLQAAARRLIAIQRADGSWRVDHSGLGGSPVTYGDALATALARRTLVRAGRREFSSQIAAADRWLREARPHATSELAGILLGLEGAEDAEAERQRQLCEARIVQAQHASGAWGQFAGHRAEAFDTAMAVLGLATLAPNDACRQAIARGRAYLKSQQAADGSWPETTRPAGATSYSHRVSTTAWATLALIVQTP